MRKDGKVFLDFVDGTGDAFWWKGENVATSEVSEAICSFPGIKRADVYGVMVPTAAWWLSSRTKSSTSRVSLRDDIEVTGTFKYSKTDLGRQGYDPATTTDLIYFDNRESQTFNLLDNELFDRIQTGDSP